MAHLPYSACPKATTPEDFVLWVDRGSEWRVRKALEDGVSFDVRPNLVAAVTSAVLGTLSAILEHGEAHGGWAECRQDNDDAIARALLLPHWYMLETLLRHVGPFSRWNTEPWFFVSIAASASYRYDFGCTRALREVLRLLELHGKLDDVNTNAALDKALERGIEWAAVYSRFSDLLAHFMHTTRTLMRAGARVTPRAAEMLRSCPDLVRLISAELSPERARAHRGPILAARRAYVAALEAAEAEE